MKKLVVHFRDGFVNLPGDKIEFNQDCAMLFAYRDNELIGVFDISTVMDAYISDAAEREARNKEQ